MNNGCYKLNVDEVEVEIELKAAVEIMWVYWHSRKNRGSTAWRNGDGIG